MQISTRLSEAQVKEILDKHFASRSMKVKAITMRHVESDGDPRGGASYSYIECDLEMPDP